MFLFIKKFSLFEWIRIKSDPSSMEFVIVIVVGTRDCVVFILVRSIVQVK